INGCDVFYSKNFDREAHHAWSEEHEIHAEMNALMFTSKENISVNGATMYVSHHPCNNCLKNMIQAGIKKVVYLYDYDKRNPKNDLLSFIEVVKYTEDKILQTSKTCNVKDTELLNAKFESNAYAIKFEQSYDLWAVCLDKNTNTKYIRLYRSEKIHNHMKAIFNNHYRNNDDVLYFIAAKALNKNAISSENLQDYFIKCVKSYVDNVNAYKYERMNFSREKNKYIYSIPELHDFCK
ncbi:MAG: deaminase, partial [Clostridia bacterium]